MHGALMGMIKLQAVNTVGIAVRLGHGRFAN